jgi:predicted dehydrogenase
VIVASPPACHVPDATTVSAAGVRAVVEKPPAPDLVTARALRDLRPEPWIGFNRRFDPGLGRMRADLPDSGWLELRLELRYRRSGWQPVAVRDDALADLGTHVADLAGWLGGGRPVAVEGAAATSTTASFEIELERGRARQRTDRTASGTRCAIGTARRSPGTASAVPCRACSGSLVAGDRRRWWRASPGSSRPWRRRSLARRRRSARWRMV